MNDDYEINRLRGDLEAKIQELTESLENLQEKLRAVERRLNSHMAEHHHQN